MNQIIEVKVPEIGDFKAVPVIEIQVKPGDAVKAEDSLITLESDKATFDVPAPATGIVKEVTVKVGDKVGEGSVILLLETGEMGQAKSAEKHAAPAPAIAAPAEVSAPVAPVSSSFTPRVHLPSPGETAAELQGGHKPHASPAIRQFARELGVDLGKIDGRGPKNRITREDVQAFVKQAMSGGAPAAASAGTGTELRLLPWPQVDFSKFGTLELKPLSRIKKLSGPILARNWAMIPHVTQFDEADITDLEALRQLLNKENELAGVKLTMLAFVIKAVVSALKKFPDFNASLDGDSLVLKHYFHIGFATDTPNGLVVPVIREADRKSVADIAAETATLAARARSGELSAAEMQGGCFTISSLGGVGGTSFTPIINAPELAILGLSRSETKPKWNGSAFEPRLMLPLSLSYDHRVIDGAAAARFTSYLGQVLADMRRSLL